jgi:hypothetical protein
MYAYIRQIGCGFFVRVCRLEDRPPTSRDPPHPGIREWLHAGIVSGDFRYRLSMVTALISCC